MFARVNTTLLNLGLNYSCKKGFIVLVLGSLGKRQSNQMSGKELVDFKRRENGGKEKGTNIIFLI